MLIILLACLHQAPSGPLYESAQHQPPTALASVFASQAPDQVFQEAVARRKEGDSRGAIERLTWLRAQGDSSAALLYQLGLAYETQGDFETALSVYDLLISEDIEDQWGPDAGFRRAMCLEDLGEWGLALEQYRAISARGLQGKDLGTLALAEGIAELHAGRPKAAQRHLQRALEQTQDRPELSWMRAKALYHLQIHQLAFASDYPLDTPKERHQAKALQERAGQIVLSERLLVQIVYLQEPEWILKGLLALGDAYLLLHDELLTLPPPAGLSAEQAALYQQELAKKVQTLARKAWEAYDQGLVVAGTFGVDDELLQALQQRQASMGL